MSMRALYDPAQLKGSILNPIQIRAIKAGLCPFCRKKSLEKVTIRAISDWEALRCADCDRDFFI